MKFLPFQKETALMLIDIITQLCKHERISLVLACCFLRNGLPCMLHKYIRREYFTISNF